MIHKPIVISDQISPIENPRQRYMEEEVSKNKGKKAFVFSSYMTEKERLEIYEKEKKRNEDINRKLIYGHNKNFIDEKILLGLVQQPQLRFKPRSDLERLIDSLSKNNNISNNEKKILFNQMKQMNIGVPFTITSDALNNPLLKNSIQGKNPFSSDDTKNNNMPIPPNYDKYSDSMAMQINLSNQDNNVIPKVSKNIFNSIQDTREKEKK